MSKLDTAMDRFSGSLDRLEALLNRRAAQIRGKAGGEVPADIAALRDDRNRLAEELDVMKAEVRRLSDLNQRASRDIAGAVDGIRNILAAE
ncbi:DUF4164 family protein [Tepidicaulis sp. LMO-SS28]|uniref:DUF4164 family protein n=1 Tax=Tepidicaulis sp. LMO-SS28 TaxID=3447455 RepID=UPI003EDFDF82